MNFEEFTDSRVELPITSFPPFKLRSSMVDKDPVIWVHLIEVYIKYVQTLTRIDVQLTDKSFDQLVQFISSYLFEIAEEQGQILSLGLINVQITENLNILRIYILELIKKLGVLNLKLGGQQLWNLAKIYAPHNATLVRSIIDGTYKPQDKRSISSIISVQKYLETKISNSKFDKYDLKILAILLQNKVGVSTRSTSLKKINSKKSPLNFNDAFVSVFWFELLEKFYAKGQGRFADICKDLAILSLISVSTSRIAALATELGISSYHTLALYSLFGGVITSTKFKQINPGLERKLPFLLRKSRPINTSKKPPNQDDINTLLEFFPNLTISKTQILLKNNDNDVERVTNILLEDPGLIDAIGEDEIKAEDRIPEASQIIQKKVNLPKKFKHSHVPDEHKNKTLAAALQLMYEADEDERDDTYDEAEVAATPGATVKLDKVERILLELFKSDQAQFSRDQRGSKNRKDLKIKTKWSDEQIEGWARMLSKDSKRYRLIEERYMNEILSERSRSIHDDNEEDINGGVQLEKSHNDVNNQKQQNNKNKVKQQHARNEKNKSSRANHNRKRGHDKKMTTSHA
ncbi:hypothetical protein WICMUC_000864 [Wickerhamomyces mucosus]|uniref:CUE domain-containing protein n=1 Tax=Wickerhamomyces mucosus TaxID=1378264 RepID=A0A9P8PXW9_9ASCO|nr:hypothetical protein WICMUC_000864 [Wickerhamomyces mucosus]